MNNHLIGKVVVNSTEVLVPDLTSQKVDCPIYEGIKAGLLTEKCTFSGCFCVVAF